MKLRTILKIISFVLLIFSTINVFRFPLSCVLEAGLLRGEIIKVIYVFISMPEMKLAETCLYVLFALHMHMLDMKFPKAEFGRYFRYDLMVAIINHVIITMSYTNPVVGYIAKISVEVAACITTFMCGLTLCKILKNNGMQLVGISYILLSLNHVLYSIFIIVQLYMMVYGSVGLESFLTFGWQVAQWTLVVPLLIVSRVMLFRGTMKLKVHKHKDNEV